MTTFRVATEADDAVLRAMLRDNGMPTWVEMTIEREPSFFAGKDRFGRDWAVIAEDSEQVVGMYTAAVMPVHLNGAPTQLGYLGGLRVNPGFRRRIRYLRDGYASVQKLAPVDVTSWFTVVAAENVAARRLLEAGITGLPAYYPQGDYVTFALPVSRGKRLGLWRRAEDAARVVSFYNEYAARFQYAPVLNEELVHALDFYECDGAVAALWDQRAFKQIVARRYRQPVASLRPVYNAYARLLRRIPLPREGQSLDQTFIAFLAMRDGVDGYTLLRDLLSHCRTPVASLGVQASHPLIPAIRRFAPMSYPARIYEVSFGVRRLAAAMDCGGSPPPDRAGKLAQSRAAASCRTPQPEAALL